MRGGSGYRSRKRRIVKLPSEISNDRQACDAQRNFKRVTRTKGYTGKPTQNEISRSLKKKRDKGQLV